jgi:DNA repair ATPase RecN
MLPTIIVSVLLGGLVGYAAFYFRYDNKHFIDELRNNLTNTRNELEQLRNDSAEFEQQNIILREKVTEMLSKNEDLSKIVGELSRAYYRIKLASEKMDELQSLLKIDDKGLEEKMQHTMTGSIGEKLAEKLLADKPSTKKR